MLVVPEVLCQLPILCELDLSGNLFETLPACIKRLTKLEKICISYCKNLQSLPQLPSSTRTVLAHECVALEATSQVLGRTLEILVLSNCFKLAEAVDLISEHMDSVLWRLQFVCLPGRTVPRCFHHQNEGHFLAVRLGSWQFCSELVGFAASIVVDARGSYHIDSFKIRWTCRCLHRGTSVHIFSGEVGLPGIGVRTSAMEVQSDHLFLFGRRLKRKHDETEVFDKVMFEFYCEDPRTGDLQVKECGVCLRFQDGLQKSKSSILHPTPFSIERRSTEDAPTELVSAHEYSRIWEEEPEPKDEINDSISNQLFSPTSSDLDGLVGMDVRMEAMLKLLNLEATNEIRLIGIWGAGGVGKTSLARYVYEHTSRLFQSYCFQESMKKIDQDYGLSRLQEELSKNLQGGLTIMSSHTGSGNLKTRFRHQKVLLVADDVDRIEQLDVVTKAAGWFGPGSRVIITTRDKDLLVTYGIRYAYEVECLGHSEALQLFSQHAFEQNHPPIGFEQLSDRAVKFAGGLPLALILLGSFLRAISEDEWESSLYRLEASTDKDIARGIKISPNKLIEEDKSTTGSVSSGSTSPRTSDCDGLVAMDRHMKAMYRLLDLESDNEFRMIGISGMEGVGKMTLARYVYEEISSTFQNHCFLENVKKIHQKHGPLGLQEELLLKNLGGEPLKIRSSIVGYNDIKARLGDRKVLLVIDGVDKIEQLDVVAKDASWFGSGSRVIVTSKDKSLLVSYGIKHVYEVGCLRYDEALELFSQSAFKKKYPPIGFEGLSVRSIQLVGRLPLGLKMFGSFLHCKSEEDWENVLRGLEATLDEDTLKLAIKC